jgi:hypothetical protein
MSKPWRTEGTVEKIINATPEEVYLPIADVTGTGGRSAECRSCESFAFRTVPERIDPTRKDSTTWTFALTPHGSGTHVEHSYVITKLPGAPFKSIFGRAIPRHRDKLHSTGTCVHRWPTLLIR